MNVADILNKFGHKYFKNKIGFVSLLLTVVFSNMFLVIMFVSY